MNSRTVLTERDNVDGFLSISRRNSEQFPDTIIFGPLLKRGIQGDARRPISVKNPARTSAHPAPSEMPLATSVA
jgi:hypothetical protein